MEEAGPFQIIPYFMGGAPKLTLFVSTSNRNCAEKMNTEMRILKILTCETREGVADGFVIDYYHCRINDIQGLISLIVQ